MTRSTSDTVFRDRVATPIGEMLLIADGAAIELLGPLSDSELRPVFTSIVERTTQDVTLGEGDDAALIEVAFDRGRIELPDGQSRDLCEVELELKSGTPAMRSTLASG